MKKEDIIAKINPLIFKGIAHRGLHNDLYPENSISAFKNAIKCNVSIELDVHLTRDGNLVVFHDDDLARMTGKSGAIEDLTLEELNQNYALNDNSHIPTFEEVLNLVDEQVPLIIELKVFRRNYRPLAKKVIQVLHHHVRDYKNYMLISFDPRVFFYLYKERFVTSLLVAKEHKWTYHLRFLADSVDLEYWFLKEKRVIRYRNKHLVNVWTIDKEELLKEYFNYSDLFTFEGVDIKTIRTYLIK